MCIVYMYICIYLYLVYLAVPQKGPKSSPDKAFELAHGDTSSPPCVAPLLRKHSKADGPSMPP